MRLNTTATRTFALAMTLTAGLSAIASAQAPGGRGQAAPPTPAPGAWAFTQGQDTPPGTSRPVTMCAMRLVLNQSTDILLNAVGPDTPPEFRPPVLGVRVAGMAMPQTIDEKIRIDTDEQRQDFAVFDVVDGPPATSRPMFLDAPADAPILARLANAKEVRVVGHNWAISRVTIAPGAAEAFARWNECRGASRR